jgi:hypothetical protein
MHWEFSLDCEGNVYFAGNSPGGLGMNDIYGARFIQGGYEKPANLGQPVNLGRGVNSPSIELCPVVTADGQYLFFLSQRDGESHAYWVSAKVIEKARPAAQAPRDKSRLDEPPEKRFNEIDPPFSRMRY